jgi:hypothetical protein
VADGTVYLGALSPTQIPGQKIWVHRRNIMKQDVEHFAANLRHPGEPYMPAPPYSLERARSLSHLYRVYWNFGQGRLVKARENLDMAFRIDPTLNKEIELVARRLYAYHDRLTSFLDDQAAKPDFIDWTLEQLNIINGAPFVSKLSLSLQRVKAVALARKTGVYP